MAAALLCTTPLLLAGCESTQSKSAKAERAAGAAAPAAEGLAVTTPSKDIKAMSTTVLTDPAVGTVAVVELRNVGQDAYEVPVLISVTDAADAERFSNATPGIQRSLTHAAVVPSEAPTWWVNDQIPVTEGPLQATARVGEPEGVAPTTPVRFSVTVPTLEEDPVSGYAANGFIKHDGADEQRRVVVNVIARKGTRIVAAGRGIAARVKPGKRARYSAFFIGDPQGAELTATAQPNIDPE